MCGALLIFLNSSLQFIVLLVWDLIAFSQVLDDFLKFILIMFFIRVCVQDNKSVDRWAVFGKFETNGYSKSKFFIVIIVTSYQS